MNTARAQSIGTMAAVVTIGATSYDAFSKGGPPSTRTVVAGLLAFGFIGIVAEAAPEVAAGLAIALGVTAFTTYALPAITDAFPEGGRAPARTTRRTSTLQTT